MDSLIFPNILLEKNARIIQRHFAELEQICMLRSFCTIDHTISISMFNKHIKIRSNTVYFSHFSNHGISFIGNLVDIKGK